MGSWQDKAGEKRPGSINLELQFALSNVDGYFRLIWLTRSAALAQFPALVRHGLDFPIEAIVTDRLVLVEGEVYPGAPSGANPANRRRLRGREKQLVRVGFVRAIRTPMGWTDLQISHGRIYADYLDEADDEDGGHGEEENDEGYIEPISEPMQRIATLLAAGEPFCVLADGKSIEFEVAASSCLFTAEGEAKQLSLTQSAATELAGNIKRGAEDTFILPGIDDVKLSFCIY